MITSRPRSRRKIRTVTGRSFVCVVSMIGVALGSVASAPAAPTPDTAVVSAPAKVRLHDHNGIHVVAATWVNQRMLDVTMSTAALAKPVHVRVLVPSSYFVDTTRRYSSIYLLHGCAAGRPSNGLEYLEWSNNDVEAITKDAPAIVVMPEAGGGGFYTDWSNGGAGGQPKWETFHIEQLLPWIDHNFRTIADRANRAIAGLSMGGIGSLSYASRHPDLFGSAAAFSGAAALTNAEGVDPLASVVVTACAASDGGGADSIFGSPTTDELNWRAHGDPARLVTNLRNTSLYLYTGNGQPGPLDPPGTGVSVVEVLAHMATVAFHDQLVAADIASFFDDYGPGTHAAVYFKRSFQDVLPRFLADFATPRPQVPFTYQTADSRYSVFGWQVKIDRLAGEFSVIQDAGVEGFRLSGSGSATVVTGPVLERRQVYCVAVHSGTSVTTDVVRANREGALRVKVPLGAPNPDQQFTAAADAAGTNVYTSTVTFTRAPGGPRGRACH